jgi:hypothetical protein
MVYSSPDNYGVNAIIVKWAKLVWPETLVKLQMRPT